MRRPYGYQRERRVVRAKTLLAESSYRIAEVAPLVGFRSQSHLGRVFRNATSADPRVLSDAAAGVCEARASGEGAKRGVALGWAEAVSNQEKG